MIQKQLGDGSPVYEVKSEVPKRKTRTLSLQMLLQCNDLSLETPIVQKVTRYRKDI